VLLPFVEPARLQLTLHVKPFGDAALPPRVLSTLVNGERLPGERLRSGWQEYTWDLPASVLRAGLNRLLVRVVPVEPVDTSPEVLRVGVRDIRVARGAPDGG